VEADEICDVVQAVGDVGEQVPWQIGPTLGCWCAEGGHAGEFRAAIQSMERKSRILSSLDPFLVFLFNFFFCFLRYLDSQPSSNIWGLLDPALCAKKGVVLHAAAHSHACTFNKIKLAPFKFNFLKSYTLQIFNPIENLFSPLAFPR
jgi:hypothetical protein